MSGNSEHEGKKAPSMASIDKENGGTQQDLDPFFIYFPWETTDSNCTKLCSEREPKSSCYHNIRKSGANIN